MAIVLLVSVFGYVIQEEYNAEGINWEAVGFVDNTECLDLIVKKPTGLLPLLDEESRWEREREIEREREKERERERGREKEGKQK